MVKKLFLGHPIGTASANIAVCIRAHENALDCGELALDSSNPDHIRATSALPPKADVRLYCAKCSDGPL